MLGFFGNLLLIIIILISFINIIISYYYKRCTVYCNLSTFGCAAVTQLILIYAFLISDFSIENVFLNSHQIKPVIYKIAGAWGNHEGSLILILFIISSYGAYLTIKTSKNVNDFISSYRFQSIVTIFLTLYILITSNPFRILNPAPSEGLGLNPLLQDIALAIHPPILYMGYMGFIVPFVIILGELRKKKEDINLPGFLYSSIKLSWGLLTLGIGLGSWWAYRELGWGGFWFWDPVENISLIPWLAATALLHTSLVYRQNGKLKHWFLGLSLLVFIYCLIGAFLVRSGLITSVHSFANASERGVFLIIFILVLASFALYNYLRFKLNYNEEYNFAFLSKESMIRVNNIILFTGSLIIILAIFYPIISYVLFKETVSVGELYYEKTFLPLMMPIILLAAIGQLIKSLKNNKKLAYKVLSSLILSAILLAIYIDIYCYSSILAILGIYFSINLFLTSLLQLITDKVKNVSLFLAHAGFALLIFSALTATKYSIFKEHVFKKNEEILVENYTVKFIDVKYEQGKNYLSRIAMFLVKDSNGNSFLLKPETRLYPVEKTTTTETVIHNKIFEDIYMASGEYDDNKETIHIRVYIRKLISFIWLSVIMMFSSSILRYLKNIKLEKMIK